MTDITQLEADLAQYVKDGLITQEEATELLDRARMSAFADGLSTYRESVK